MRIRPLYACVALAFMWAGLSLGGTLIAAPAKFEAPNLPLPLALEVGRAQFFWVGIAEYCLGLVMALLLLLGTGRRRFLFLIPLVLLIIQRAVLMPVLDAQTMNVIAGAPVPDRLLHRIYIVLEISKFLSLLVFGFRSLARMDAYDGQPRP